MAQNLGYSGGTGTDGDSQVPSPLPKNAKDRISRTEAFEIQKSPNAVYIGNIAGNVGFFFGTSASFATAAQSEGGTTLTASAQYKQFGSPSDGTILNIHPTAYSASNADSSSVFFIYSSGLRTGPY